MTGAFYVTVLEKGLVFDTDGDGMPEGWEMQYDGIETDEHDADDDEDGIPTSQELGSGGALNPADSDGDGTPDYLSKTRILTGLDGGAGAVNPLYFIAMLLITIIRNRQSRCLAQLKNH